MTVTIEIELPEDAFSVLRKGPAEFAEELKRAAVSKWYELGMLSQSKGAAILGISRAAFLEVLARHEVAVFQTSPEELRAEVKRG